MAKMIDQPHERPPDTKRGQKALGVVAHPGTPSAAAARFVQQLRSWREGDSETQRKEWEQLEEVLAEDGRL